MSGVLGVISCAALPPAPIVVNIEEDWRGMARRRTEVLSPRHLALQLHTFALYIVGHVSSVRWVWGYERILFLHAPSIQG